MWNKRKMCFSGVPILIRILELGPTPTFLQVVQNTLILWISTGTWYVSIRWMCCLIYVYESRSRTFFYFILQQYIIYIYISSQKKLRHFQSPLNCGMSSFCTSGRTTHFLFSNLFLKHLFFAWVLNSAWDVGFNGFYCFVVFYYFIWLFLHFFLLVSLFVFLTEYSTLPNCVVIKYVINEVVLMLYVWFDQVRGSVGL